MAEIKEIKVGGTTYDLHATTTNIAYCTCATAAATAVKAIDVVDNEYWELVTGAIIMVKFTNSNTAEQVTLNVNSTGAYPIWYNNEEYTGTGTAYTGYAGRVTTYMFNGTHWVWIASSYDSNTTYTNVKLGHGYTTCSTAAATKAKTAALSSYTLTTGGIVAVKFTYDVPASATLNINSKGAKAIYYKGAAITAGVIKAGDTATFIYSSQYHLISLDRLSTIIDEGAGANSILVGEISTNTAAGDYAYAGGRESVASGVNSHAEGYKATASGSFAYAQGRMTTASGYASHAEGTEAVAKGYASHAEGMGTIAGSSYQHVQGLYNIEDTTATYLHIVGNGGGSSLRSNAHTLDKDGNAWFAGDVYVGGTNQASGEKLVKQSELPITYTQSEVDALIAAVKTFCLPKVASITLSENSWNFSANYYYQDVPLGCCTPTSKVDLQPTYAQLATWQDDGLAFTTQSKDGIVRVWAIPDAPREDITIQVTVQEVLEV